MRKIDRRIILTALGASAVGACTAPFEIGEGKKQPKGGIGGTGIVGVLTDFGSVIVNGLRVALNDETETTDAFGAVAPDRLSIGQSLTIEAASIDDGLVASRIHITHAVIGRVTPSSAPDGSATVNGITVVPEPGMIGDLRGGARVAVSGVWRGATVIASRVDELPLGGSSVLSGSVTRAPDGTGVAIGDRRILTESSFLPAPGSFATVIGDERRDGLRPDRIVAGRFTGAAGPLQSLSVEGYLDPIEKAPFFTLSGLGHSFDRDAKLAEFRMRRAIYSGSYDGDFRVQTGVPLPETLPERRAMLKDLLNGDAQTTLPVR
ncbi:MAG: DUF5666 domain-containing protein [Pseudomonadota bacterium]